MKFAEKPNINSFSCIYICISSLSAIFLNFVRSMKILDLNNSSLYIFNTFPIYEIYFHKFFYITCKFDDF